MDPITLNLFASRLSAVCDEMGATLRNAAFSPNIRDRLDFSCAVFDARGELCAQAAHIPVHLGSMAYAMRDLVSAQDWRPRDQLVVNDPFLGGTHLPDVTLVAPVFSGGELCGFVANRAHHADIGADSPGSMPLSARLEEEGLIIPPRLLVRAGELDEPQLASIVAETANQAESRGDFEAQLSANQAGATRLNSLIGALGAAEFGRGLAELNDYAERLARDALGVIPVGTYEFTDYLDDDGLGHTDLPIQVRLSVDTRGVLADFTGTAAQAAGNVNCPLSVAAAAVFYVFRCLMPEQTPACAGAFRPIRLSAPAGCLLNARRPAAVAAGNVETSTRIVDVVCGALAQAIPELIPAASQGSMNNLAMGAPQGWSYYETLAGGAGASVDQPGQSARQTHMTNTLNTPVEVLESRFPLRMAAYQVRSGSGGAGRRRGGDGVIREYEFLRAASVTLLTERRERVPWGLAGGEPGTPGLNRLNGERLPGKCQRDVQRGDHLRLETPGGGGYGRVGS